MQRAILLATCALGAVWAAGCAREGAGFVPPEPTAAVRAEQERLAPLIEKYERDAFSGAKGTCAVRLLGTQGASSFAWARCDFPGEGGGRSGGVSAPFRVDGVDVRVPGDGDQFAKDVRELFPMAMVSAILNDPDRLRPTEAAPVEG